MKLRNGNRFRIACREGEIITYVLKSGTVKRVATDLDGVAKVLKQGDELVFVVTASTPRSLAVSYVFVGSGNDYSAEVTGDAGGDVSLDAYTQPAGMASKERIYSFKVLP